MSLRFLLGSLFLLVLFAQVFVLPWASGDYASWYPEVADMRWPILRLSIAGLVCVQVGIVCIMLLLGLTLDGDVFSRPALRWVDTIIGSFLAGSLVCLLAVFYLSSGANGPPFLILMLFFGFVAGVGLALPRLSGSALWRRCVRRSIASPAICSNGCQTTP